MAQENQKEKLLSYVLIGVMSFAGGLLGLGIVVIILSALGIFVR